MEAIKSAIFAIALLCGGCIAIPIFTPIPISTDPLPDKSPGKLDEKYRNTCYADALSESEGLEVTETSDKLETAGDKLAAAGKNKEAIRRYNEASAAALKQAIADNSVLEMEFDTFLYSKEEIEEFRKKYRPLVQKSAEYNFKIGSSYAKIGKYTNAIDCFDSALKIGILPPNDATTYLNRGDAYERMGEKAKARTDFQKAANLFKKYKQQAYQKISEQRLQRTK